MDILIIKLGGSAITEKGKKFSVREGVLNRVAEELASIPEKFVLVHGGGSFGHPVASEYEISEGYSDNKQLIGFSKTHQAMEKLNSKVIDALINAGEPAVPVQTSACFVVKNGGIVSAELENIKKLLDLGITPVLYGDSMADLEKGMSILSGDQILAYLAQELKVSEAILGVDTEGIYTNDPKKSEKSELIPKITAENWEKIKSRVKFSSKSDVTGGMKNKIEVLIDLAKKGIESKVVNATKPKILKQAIRSDKKVGTKISME